MDGIDLNITDYVKFVLAFVFVLALIAITTIIARRLGFGLPISSRFSAERRLGIAESLNVDGKRRLVLVRRDEVEHLILLGATSELVIENNITPPENSFSKAIQDATQATETQSQLIIRKEKVPQGPPLPKNLLNNPKNDKQNSDSEKKT